jgi:ADP-ribosylglycohydrolase
MLPPTEFLRKRLEQVVASKAAQGYDTARLLDELKQIPDSHDALAAFAKRLRDIPLRKDWPYEEPNDLQAIWAACDPSRPMGPLVDVSGRDMAPRIETAFLSAVCGCMLGKPLEVDPTLTEIRQAAESVGEWPIRDYISASLLEKLGRRPPDWHHTVRQRIAYVAPDDDINYMVIGMLILERKGLAFTKDDLANYWLYNLPPSWTWGPERTVLIKAAIHSLAPEFGESSAEWAESWNPSDEACGAAIRVDAYGYACPGRPALAAELAWRDSSFTHRRTGIYGAMFIAAAIATAFVTDNPLDIFETALKFVPIHSRFYAIVSDCFQIVAGSSNWLEGYEKIHAKYGQYRHCSLYQECGLLINSACFATDIGDALCKQVSQGCDTDCFGKLIGSIMGAYFGAGYLEERWLTPFNDDLRTSLAIFYDRSLRSVAKRMAALAATIETMPSQNQGGTKTTGPGDA